MSPYILIVLAHSAVITPQLSRQACLVAAHKAAQHGQIAECIKRLPRPHVSLDSDGVTP